VESVEVFSADRVEPVLWTLLREYIVIMDCTSATKPATITYYELAQNYLIPLIYIYEKTTSLKWLVSKETIKKKLRIGSESRKWRTLPFFKRCTR